MSYQLKEGYGNMFKNSKKEEGDNKPNLQGEVMFGGKVCQIAGWTKLDKNGEKYISLKIQAKRD